MLLLLVTTLQMSGQFVVFTFMGPLLTKLTQAGPDAIGLVFAVYGVFGFIGIAIATRIVNSWGAYKTSLLFTTLLLTGVTGWALSAGIYPLMACSVAIWGLGFASTNSMQQVRLVAAAPALASGLGIAQHLGALHRAGGWLGDRRHAVCPRSPVRRGLRRGGLRRTGAADGDADKAAASADASGISTAREDLFLVKK